MEAKSNNTINVIDTLSGGRMVLLSKPADNASDIKKAIYTIANAIKESGILHTLDIEEYHYEALVLSGDILHLVNSYETLYKLLGKMYDITTLDKPYDIFIPIEITNLKVNPDVFLSTILSSLVDAKKTEIMINIKDGVSEMCLVLPYEVLLLDNGINIPNLNKDKQ